MSQVEVVLAANAKLAECPRWDVATQSLYWIDINAMQLHRYDPQTRKNTFLQFEQEIGCFSLRKKGGFILAMRHGYYFLDDWSAKPKAILDPEADLDKTRFNDGRCDANGRLFAGSYYPPKDYDGANLWCLHTDLSVEKIAGDLLTTNGIAFSPDNRIFYYADTPKHIIYQCDYDIDTGTVENRRTFCTFPKGLGRPDGASVDAEGYYWTALYEGARVVRISPSGEIVQEIQVPAKCPTMVAFGDADLKTLYITTAGERPAEELVNFPHAGALLKVRVDVPGLPEHCFGA